MAKSYLGQMNLPRGIRNNNPGNLVKTSITWLGKVEHSKNTDSRFEQFIELRYGIRALMRDVMTDISKGKNTVSALITEFAPAFENNTTAYINTVANMVGIAVNFPITQLTDVLLIKICKAIVYVENGASYSSYISDQDYNSAIAILGKSSNITITEKKKITR